MSLNIYPDEVHRTALGTPEYTPEIDAACEHIKDATDGLGTDEQLLIDVLGSKATIERSLIAYRYKEMYGVELKELMKKENTGDFSFLLQLLSLPALDAEAKIVRKATKGAGTDERLLLSVLCGRSNEELQLLKKAYFARYKEDIVSVVDSEVHGDMKKLIMACLQGMEETESVLGRTKTRSFDIICKAPPQYLRMVDDCYVAENNVNLQKALEKELSGKAEDAAIHTVNMKLKPYDAIAEHIKSTCKGMGTDELGLSCAILRYQHVLQSVQIAHINLSSKTIADRVESETRGDFERLLLEMVKVAWPQG
ncbi:hypothetical protein ACHAXT_009424 [Thalassiosira profunda]